MGPERCARNSEQKCAELGQFEYWRANVWKEKRQQSHFRFFAVKQKVLQEVGKTCPEKPTDALLEDVKPPRCNPHLRLIIRGG